MMDIDFNIHRSFGRNWVQRTCTRVIYYDRHDAVCALGNSRAVSISSNKACMHHSKADPAGIITISLYY